MSQQFESGAETMGIASFENKMTVYSRFFYLKLEKKNHTYLLVCTVSITQPHIISTVAQGAEFLSRYCSLAFKLSFKNHQMTLLSERKK